MNKMCPLNNIRYRYNCKRCEGQKNIISIECHKYTPSQPETAWEMFQRLKNKYGDKFVNKEIPINDECSFFIYGLLNVVKTEPEAIEIMQQIEQEAKDGK
jgi:hypothetical protein